MLSSGGEGRLFRLLPNKQLYTRNVAITDALLLMTAHCNNTANLKFLGSHNTNDFAHWVEHTLPQCWVALALRPEGKGSTNYLASITSFTDDRQ